MAPGTGRSRQIDDGQDDHDSSAISGGPNGPVILDTAQPTYERR
jgi:hypothetical protein